MNTSTHDPRASNGSRNVQSRECHVRTANVMSVTYVDNDISREYNLLLV